MLRCLYKGKQRKQAGQSTVEYLVLMGSVLAIIIVFLSSKGPFQKTVNETYSDGIENVDNISKRLWKSMGPR